MPSLRTISVLSLLVILAFAVFPDEGQGWFREDDDLKRADKLFAQKTYKPAIELYEKVLDDADRPEADRAKSLHRIGISLQRINEFDDALKRLAVDRPFIRSDLWQARLLALRAKITLRMPHYYYAKDGKKIRGRWVQGGVYHATQRQDMLQGMKFLQDGVPRFVRALESKKVADDTGTSELNAAAFMMAQALEGFRDGHGGLKNFGPSKSVTDELKKAGITGGTVGTDPQKWYQFAEKEALKYKRRESAAYARYLEGSYCRRLAAQYNLVDPESPGSILIKCRVPNKRGDEDIVDFPDAWNPFRIFASVSKDYSGCDVEDDAMMAMGLFAHECGRFILAEKTFVALEQKFPKGFWVRDARAWLQSIRMPELTIANPAPILPGDMLKLEIACRNLKDVDVRAYRVDLAKVLTSRRYLTDSKASFGDLARLVKKMLAEGERLGRPDMQRALETPDEGHHRRRNFTTEFEMKERGAYLIEVSSGDIAYQVMALVSDISAIRKVGQKNTIVYVVDARTGQPMPGAKVLVRQKHRDTGFFGRYQKITHADGATDADGLYRRPHVDSPQRWFSIEAFARQGENYALTSFTNHQLDKDPAARTTVYAFTDRPVYRPLDEVHFVGNLRLNEDGDYKNLPGQEVRVWINDAKGNKIYDQPLTADEFGAVSDRIALGEEPPLGSYQVYFRIGKRTVGRQSFRVEEYKKPEFEVLVKGPSEQIRVGDPFKTTIHAELYSGGGVADAKVVYRVFRRPHRPDFWRPSRHSWFYGRRAWAPPGPRELIESGEGTMDADGNFVLTLDTAALSDRYPKEDHKFEIEADVTDLSRRTISGSSTVLITRTALFASVSTSRGFARSGERAAFEIKTETPSGQAIATKGRVQIFRVTTTEEAEKIVEHRSQVDSIAAATNDEGEGAFAYEFDSPGRFVLSYATEDKWGTTVTGEHAIWVSGSDYRATDFHFKNIEIIADRESYQPGETAYVLINGTFADASVFFTIEAGRSLLQHEVLKLNGKSRVLAIPIPETFSPNVFLHAMMAQGGRFYQTSQELRVPPTRKFLDVDLAFDQDVYQPSDTVNLTIQSRDYQGKGVPAQFALRVMDKAITYIQQDGTADIRKFYYGTSRPFYGTRRWGSNTAQTMQFRFQGRIVRKPKPKRYRTHGYPSGWWLDDKAADGAFEDFRRGYLGGGRLADDEAPAEEAEMSLDSAGGLAGGSVARSAAPSQRARGKKMSRMDAKSKAPGGDNWGGDTDKGGSDLAEPDERSNFSDLAAWIPDVRTGANGLATLSFKLPDSLTTWVATVRGMTKNTLVGEKEREFQTTKNVLVRLQAPRFFTERDEIVLSGVVRNGFAEAIKVKAVLDLGDSPLEVLDALERDVNVEAGREARVDWLVRVLAPGEAVVKMKALSTRESDAVTMRFPVLEYGRQKVVTQVDVLGQDDRNANLTFDLPADRRVNSAVLDVRIAPSLGSTLLDAIPYLVEYPYGCTEQTMSRFMPAAVVARALRETGVSLEEIARKRLDLAKAGEHASHKVDPVYTEAELADVMKSGLNRLRGMQNSDGGYGWWRLDRSSVHLTCHVLHGLATARKAGYEVPSQMIDGAVRFLRSEIDELKSKPLAAYTAFALASAGHKEDRVLNYAWKHRDELGNYAKAQLALAYDAVENADRAELLLKSLEDFAVEDKKAGTVYWRSGQQWWYWYDDAIETNAYVLLALATIKPDHRYARPLASWLVRNRSGNRWKSTRDTAACVLALARYMKGAGELDPDYELVVKLGGREIKKVRVTRENMFSFDNRFLVKGDALETGRLDVTVEKNGKGVAYATGRLQYFSTEEIIKGAGHGVEVSRAYYRLTPVEKEVDRNGKKIKVLEHKRELLGDLAEVKSGDEIEVEMTLEVDNNYEYVMVEDRKPAGFEPIALRSGGRYANGLCSNMELRDEKVVFFVTWLQQGRHKISYKMRAELPGKIYAMPTKAVAMYAPKLGGISDSWRVKVEQPAR